MSREDSRWTYSRGTVAEGVIVYDQGAKLHSHHDSDPARGQSNSFDLVRLHCFGHLDTTEDAKKPVTERPSYSAMHEFAMSQPEVQAQLIDGEFEDLGELAEDEKMPVEHKKGAAALARRICDVLNTRTFPRWLIPDYIERGVIALLIGKRGTYKSFISLDWSMRIACAIEIDSREAVYVVSGEGGDFDRRALAWIARYAPDRTRESIPLYVVERRLDLSTKSGVELIRQDCVTLGIRPVLFVLDTFSKLSGGLDENENTSVKAFIGLLDNGLKRAGSGFDATVLLVAHSGHSDDGRARGASALGNDTDAEYIVKRDDKSGTVEVSRERFKSSPELPPLYYKPDVVDLDYPDSTGRNVTSLVLTQVEGSRTEGGKAKEPTGAQQRALWQLLREMSPDGSPVAVSDVLDAAGALRAVPPGRDRRRDQARQGLDKLRDDGFVFYLQGGTQVTLTRAQQIVNEDFEEIPE